MKTFTDFQIDLPPGVIGQVSTTCSQCSHTRKKSKAKCLSVNVDEALWYCHHCSWSGSLKSGQDHPSRPPKRVIKPNYKAPSVVPQAVRDWFAKRGISEEVVRRHCIGLERAYLRELEDEVPCLLFPYRRDGQVVNIKYRHVDSKTFRQVSHAEKILYGVDDLTEDWAVIVEGEPDKLACEHAGIRNAVSVPDGAPPEGSKPSDQKFDYLVNCARWLDPLKKIILAVDNDTPGKLLEEELARRLGPERCWRVTWPDGSKDANDLLTRHGAEALRHCIEAARPFPIEGVFEVRDVAAGVVDLYFNGLTRGLSTGWWTLDELYTIKPGELTIITGIPSHGKSEWLDALAVNLSQLHGWRFALCSPENFPLHRHLARLLEKVEGQPFGSRTVNGMTLDQVRDGLEWLQPHFVFVAPEEAITIEALLKTAKALVTRYGIRGLIIDPWNEFEHRRPTNVTETEYISQCLGQIRRFARNYGVHVWLVTHPMKLRRREDGSYPVPSPYDISGSAHWRNKADCCLTIWRDAGAVQHQVEIHVQKIRFREVGQVGMVTLTWDPATGRFSPGPPNSPLPPCRDTGAHWHKDDHEAYS